MKNRINTSAIILILSLFILFAAPGLASDENLPVIDGKKAVASVPEEPISLEELNKAIAASHTTRPRGEKAGRIDYSDIMERLINTRLILLEARNMGLDELPEVKDMVAKFSREALIELLLIFYVKDIKADEEDVERLYKSIVKEWKLKSIRFKNEKDAKEVESQLKAGGDFDGVVNKAVEWGTAEADVDGVYLKTKDLAVPVAAIVSEMEVGAISPLLTIGKKGFIIFKLEDIRYPEAVDPAARQQARRQALDQKKVEAARNYYEKLKQRYAKVDQSLLEGLDYESKEPGFEKLLQDKRILVEIKDEKPITVGDLTTAIKNEFYHGIELAIEAKKINKKKGTILEDRLQRTLLLQEALRQGIDQTDTYKQKVKGYENSVIFGMFIKKAVAPDIKLTREELKTYYKEHAQEYTDPEMMRIKSLVFGQRRDAVATIDKLKKGTDFNWLGANAEGQVDPNTKGLLKLEGKPVTVRSLPEKVKKALSRSRAGDFRLYESPESHFYVLYVFDIIPARQKPFEAVSQEIAKAVYKEKTRQMVELWAAQLRDYYPVEIYRADLKK
jgi:hypothetical protein